MRIRISHQTTYRYETSVKGVTQILRLTPRNHEGQYVVNWTMDISADCRLRQAEDAFGNISHSFTADGPLDTLSLAVEGEIETRDTDGIVAGSIERFPPELFLRETPLTQADATISEFAAVQRSAAGSDDLTLLHSLTKALHQQITFDTDLTHPTTTAAEAFSLKRGVCQDITHIFIAAARANSIPARYVGGYFYRADGVTAQEAGHAWAEAYVQHLGWVGFDPTNGICATEAHVRVAIGLDYLGASPVRGTRFGGSGEHMSVAVQVGQARHQTQS